MKKTPILLTGVGLLTLPAVAALAPGGTAYTKRASTALLAQPSPMADTVATVGYGRKLSISAAQGAWLNVRDGNKSGWVFKGNVSEQKIAEVKGADGLPLEASQTTASAAARPLADGAVEYANRKGLGEARADVQWLEDVTAKISPDDIRTYMQTEKKGDCQ